MMASKKKGLELIFRLEWRGKPENTFEKGIIIGMYDSPATTQSFETFKSYLLKNSGVDAKDVKISYVSGDDCEWHIDSEIGFQQALIAFRLQARLNEAIFLKLDKLMLPMASGKRTSLHRKDSNDVQTQYDPEGCNKESPPEWFFTYMKQFKNELLQDVTTSVGNILSANRPEVQPQVQPVVLQAPPPPVCPRKIRSEPSKRARKHLHLAEHVIDKTFKHERKLEIKLDKLEAKTKKIKEKKEALFNKSLAAMEAASPEKIEENKKPVEGCLDAGLAHENTQIPHLLGGEKYLHSWEVINCGSAPWPERTELRLTWGSSCMYPDQTVIKCPPLKPGDKTTLSMIFNIPQRLGQYESYWNFYLDEIRFGRWVSFGVIVDAIDPSNVLSRSPPTQQSGITYRCSDDQFVNIQVPQRSDTKVYTEGRDQKLVEVVGTLERLSINAPEKQDDSDSDWESWSDLKSKHVKVYPNRYSIEEDDLIVDLSQKSLAYTVCEFKRPVKEGNSESVPNKEEDAPKTQEDEDNNNSFLSEAAQSDCGDSDVSSSYDIVNTPLCVTSSPLPEDKEERSGYVYVTVEGNKLSLPKYMLHPALVAAAENSTSACATATNQQTEVEVEKPQPAEATLVQLDGAVDVKAVNSSASGEDARLFIFPENNPGFEVFTPFIVSSIDDQFTTIEAEVKPSAPTHAKNASGSSRNVSFSEREAYYAGPPQPFAFPSQPSAPTSSSTPKLERQVPTSESHSSSSSCASPHPHLLPEHLMNGAVNVANSAINTARSVINMMIPSKTLPGKWVNGHWVDEDPNSDRYKHLLRLEEMGFWDTNLNATLLARFNDDVVKVVAELLSYNQNQ